MKKLIVALAFFIGFNANANLITVAVSENAVSVGDTIQVTVSANMLEDFDTLGFELEFDSAFEYVDSTFYSDLDYTGGVFAGPQSYGFAFSFLDFFAASAGNYILAQFNLTATAGAYSGFDLVNVIAGLYDYSTGTIDNVVVQVDANSPSVAVSAPATLGLFAVALVAFAGFRRKV